MLDIIGAWYNGAVGWLGTSGGLVANAIQIWTGLLGGAAFVYWRLQRRISHKDAEIANLRRDVAHREVASQIAAAKADEFQKRCFVLEDKLPETALARAALERERGDDARARYQISSWLEREGGPVADLLVWQTEWAVARACGELRSAGLEVAENFARSALAINHANGAARAFVHQLTALREAEGRAALGLPDALNALQETETTSQFDAGEVEGALEARREAQKHLILGNYHLAQPLIERAVEILQRHLGVGALQTIDARRDEAHLAFLRGLPDRAEEMLRNVIASERALSTDNLPGALESHYLLSQVLHDLGKNEEALSTIRQVATAEEGMAEFGPDHSATLASFHVMATILSALGENEEALRHIRRVIASQEAILGPSHRNTLAGRFQLARIIVAIGKEEEALRIIRAVAAAQQMNSTLGTDHPDTLRSNFLLGDVLCDLSRYEEALEVIRQVEAKQKASQALGPDHPDTLRSGRLLGAALLGLGNAEEALPIARRVATAMEANPALGQGRPDTLESRDILAMILINLGKEEEALPIVRCDADTYEIKVGPSHPKTMMKRSTLAAVLHRLGRNKEALPVMEEVVAAFESHSAFGPDHPVTLVNRQLHTIISTSQPPEGVDVA